MRGRVRNVIVARMELDQIRTEKGCLFCFVWFFL